MNDNYRQFHIDQLVEHNILFVDGKAITALSDKDLLLAYDYFVHCKDEYGKERKRGKHGVVRFN